MFRDKYFDISAGIYGWLSNLERDMLFLAAMEAWKPNARYIELGSFKGKSSVIIGGALVAVGGGKLYCVDPHEGELSVPQLPVGGYNDGRSIISQEPTLAAFKANILAAGLEDVIIPVVGKSTDFVPDFSPDFLFIDALHDAMNVRADWNHYKNTLKEGAVVAWHDYQSWYGVTLTVNDLLNSGIIDKMYQGDSLIVTKFRGLK